MMHTVLSRIGNRNQAVLVASVRVAVAQGWRACAQSV